MEEVIPGHDAGYAFNECVTGVIQTFGRTIPVLSSGSILLANERRKIAELQVAAQARMLELGGD